MFDISEKASEATPTQAELHRRHKERRARLASAGRKALEEKEAREKAETLPHAVNMIVPTPRTKPPLSPLVEATRIIQDFICQRYGLVRIALISQVRSKSITGPRFLAMHLTRTILGLSTTRIGALFGGRDHSTVIHAISSVERRRHRDPQFAANLTAMEIEIRELIDAKPRSWGRYVAHEDVAAYELLGWQYQAHLSDHGALMVWLCDCPVREPLVA